LVAVTTQLPAPVPVKIAVPTGSVQGPLTKLYVTAPFPLPPVVDNEDEVFTFRLEGVDTTIRVA
jgi:hypothetical protein